MQQPSGSLTLLLVQVLQDVLPGLQGTKVEVLPGTRQLLGGTLLHTVNTAMKPLKVSAQPTPCCSHVGHHPGATREGQGGPG